MSYTTAYPRIQQAFFQFNNLELAGDQSAEDAVLYEWFDDLFDICFDAAEGYCSQPLRASVINYVFTYSQARHGLESEHRWKYIPFNANTSVTAFQWRADEFGNYANVSAGNYTTSVDNGLNFVIFRNINSGQFRATLSTGWSDANLPNTVIQGIVEMASWIYKQSANGGNWFGLGSVSTGGAGQNVNASILQDLKWQRFFDKYRIAVV
jgi:hypothetical protein